MCDIADISGYMHTNNFTAQIFCETGVVGGFTKNNNISKNLKKTFDLWKLILYRDFQYHGELQL